MKTTHFLALILLLTALAGFNSCGKDIKKPVNQDVVYGNFLLMQQPAFVDCVQGPSFCVTARPENPNDVNRIQLSTDEFLARPVLNANGELSFQVTIPASNLSEEALHQLIEEKKIHFEQGFTFDEDIVRQAYKDAGNEEDPPQVEVEKGTYEVIIDNEEVDPTTNEYITIEICIKGSGWSVCITIEW